MHLDTAEGGTTVVVSCCSTITGLSHRSPGCSAARDTTGVSNVPSTNVTDRVEASRCLTASSPLKCKVSRLPTTTVRRLTSFMLPVAEVPRK